MAIDTHVHLDAAAFAADLPEVVRRAEQAGVARMLTVGTDLASSRQAVALAGRFGSVWASVGLHPHEADAATPTLEADLLALAGHERVVAIGETGLDFYRNLSAPAAQRAAFRRQIAVARQAGLPLIIHSRDAHDEVVETLAADGAERVVLHCFTGDRALARRCLERGWHLAFGGAVTYPRNAELRAVVAELPAERLLFETDAPYMAPVPHRGRRNEPAWLLATIDTCARVRGCDPDVLAAQAARNAAALFPRLGGRREEEALAPCPPC